MDNEICIINLNVTIYQNYIVYAFLSIQLIKLIIYQGILLFNKNRMPKILLNCCYGGFHFPKPILEHFGIDYLDDSIENRTNPEIIEMMEGMSNQGFSLIKAFEIDQEYLDTGSFRINEYDGMEDLVIEHEKHIARTIKKMIDSDMPAEELKRKIKELF
jgi:hypothetical protein